MKKYIAVKEWHDTYNGAGIYSLVDQNGKRYIGQAKHINDRLHQHRMELNKAALKPLLDCGICENEKMIDAVRNGTVFSVEILAKLPWYRTTVNELKRLEQENLNKYGGLTGTYNAKEVPSINTWYSPHDEVSLDVEFDDADVLQKLAEVENMSAYIKSLIRRDLGAK